MTRTSLGPTLERHGNLWSLDLTELPLLHGMSVISRALGEMIIDQARSDRVPRWQRIGAVLAADRRVELRWRGSAELFIDGVSQGHIRGGYVHAIQPGSFHFYRIVAGRSLSGYILVNP